MLYYLIYFLLERQICDGSQTDGRSVSTRRRSED